MNRFLVLVLCCGCSGGVSVVSSEADCAGSTWVGIDGAEVVAVHQCQGDTCLPAEYAIDESSGAVLVKCIVGWVRVTTITQR